MGVNVTTTHSTEIRIPVSAAVTAGDLLVNVEGEAAKASTALSLTQLNNTTVGLQSVYPLTSQGTYYGGDAQAACKRLVEVESTGEILSVVVGDGSASNVGGVRLFTTTITGAVARSPVTVTGSSASSVRITRLTADKVVIAWTESAVLKFAIYNNDGTVSVAAATVATTTSDGSQKWNIAVLTGGDIVFAYAKVTSNNANFVRYNSSGVLQGAETTVEASATPTGICVLPQTGGGFIIYYYKSSATANWKFAIYDSAGVIQGSLTTVSTGTAAQLSYGEYDNLAIELDNSNIVFQWANTAHQYSVYTSAGVLVLTVPSLASTAAANDHVAGLTQTASGGFAVVTWGSALGTCTFRAFDSGGIGITSSTFTMNARQGAQLLIQTAQGFAAMALYSDGASNYTVQLANLTSDGVLIGTVVTLYTGTVANNGACLLTHSSGVLALNYRGAVSSGILYYATYNPNKTSILGVALESVAEGATCRVATKGTYPINQSLLAAGSFDQRTATVPGTKGAIVGSTALLYGME